jgi:hypothetical protein
MENKKCINCQQFKSIIEFPKDKTRKDGLTNKCKICTRELNKKSYQKNKVSHQKRTKQWRDNNSEYMIGYSKQYRLNNPEKNKQYCQDNKEKIQQYRKQYCQDNKEKIQQYLIQFQSLKKDGKHYVYYLPEINYVGVTDNIYQRMHVHKCANNITSEDKYQIIGKFDNRETAERFERYKHSLGYIDGGKNLLSLI